ncbi:MAG TPA: type II secretion system ATPase GspE [Plasticicumulans sp.]|uniref:type II secretion system ATPase GspE n=1 Tax=Plasticicumulans sp. TaxID=2307179 RepID=UPI002B61CD6D|nr:type II secretion system ATPase GspE [Plasticicumulans sp.]HMV38748.1 type II secretion system ATPase GspE [Plasticicumulans sp.]HMW29615.1 type II secretion system ATPase GspE [Plasticicumulans sp.]HMW42756.1 type II secretion system ATPase GspE [Plasticicumulans sp.]HMX52918.1 type II secretion system ATPase GspE [Plasticicumulans sp.]HNF67126.1 type II secretion system ATPase GspE [Plasticicumulans sp.]
MNAPDLPYPFAKRHGVLVLERDARAVTVGLRAKPAAAVLMEARRVLGLPLRLQVLTTTEFDARLAARYSQAADGAARMIEDICETDLARVAQALPEPEDLLESADDAPIIRLINALLTEAIREHASDIHIECFETRLNVRLRVDGVLRDVLAPPRALGPLLVSRIKVMANLDIAEKRLPQDGRISLRVAGHAVDVRVSTIPSGHGERVVLRLLDKREGRIELSALGLGAQASALLDRLIHRPHGILLVTGPTGSGKTTTLYSALTRINETSRNIMTVEDPIEYYLDGVSQTQVNTRIDMSFARGLRALLRQDPDVIMVGEIRDPETADIAIQASMTGHLVLSTLHTNSAVGAIARLRDMGVEPFLLASSLIGVLAQRLVRRLCPHCRQPVAAGAAERRELEVPGTAALQLQVACGCPQCRSSGYRGRVGLFELVVIDEALRAAIHAGASEAELEALARTQGPSLRADGVARVLAGDTSLAELLRVTRELSA